MSIFGGGILDRKLFIVFGMVYLLFEKYRVFFILEIFEFIDVFKW